MQRRDAGLQPRRKHAHTVVPSQGTATAASGSSQPPEAADQKTGSGLQPGGTAADGPSSTPPRRDQPTRRDVLAWSTRLVTAGAAAGALLEARTTAAAAHAPTDPGPARFSVRYCLNTATIRGQNLTVEEEIDVAAAAGYDSIELWTSKLDRFVQSGGKLSDLRKRLEDHGLTVESAIGFPTWVVNELDRRQRGFEAVKRDMDLLAQIGGLRLAAPPAGANRTGGVSLAAAAERYRQLLELGDQFGVVPQLEMWGSSKVLSRLSEGLYVAAESGHPKACLLPDVFHIYKSGGNFDALRLVAGRAVHVFHLNDYPDQPPRETIRDTSRVLPGDGVAPLDKVFSILKQNGFCGVLSLELFNPNYWKQDPLVVARTGLQKMKDAVARAVSG